MRILFVTIYETEKSSILTNTIESIAWNTPINIISASSHNEYFRYVSFIRFLDEKNINALLKIRNKTETTTNVVVRRKLSDLATPNHDVSEYGEYITRNTKAYKTEITREITIFPTSNKHKEKLFILRFFIKSNVFLL